MPTLQVFKYETLIDGRQFSMGLHMIVEGEKVVWQTDEEHEIDRKGWGTYVNPPRYESIWLVGSPSVYWFQFIRPDWGLELNGQRCPLGLYVRVEVFWSRVSLTYNYGYRFVFLFEPHEIRLNEGTPLPKSEKLRSEFGEADKSFPIDFEWE